MAPQLKIHVDGTGSVFRQAERGALFIRVLSSDRSQATASSAVASTTESLINTFRQYALKTSDGSAPHPSAGITTFTASPPTTTSALPYKDGREVLNGVRMYTTSTSAEVVFRDLSLLARLATEMAAMPYVTIQRTEWRLTAATRVEIKREARVQAIRDALQKAEDYAGVVGREVVAVSIEDGQFNTGSFRLNDWVHQQKQMQVQAAPGHMAPTNASFVAQVNGPALEPSTITVSANVDVRFISTDGEDTC